MTAKRQSNGEPTPRSVFEELKAKTVALPVVSVRWLEMMRELEAKVVEQEQAADGGRDMLEADDVEEACSWCGCIVPSEDLRDAEREFGGLCCGWICTKCAQDEETARNENDECRCGGSCRKCVGERGTVF